MQEQGLDIVKAQRNHAHAVKAKLDDYLQWARSVSNAFCYCSSNDGPSRILYILFFDAGRTIAIDIDCALPAYRMTHHHRNNRLDWNKRMNALGFAVATIAVGRSKQRAVDEIIPILRQCNVKGID